jgi:hypothetical protein
VTVIVEQGETYYVRVVAKDPDGSAAPSDAVEAQPVQVNSPDIAAEAVIAQHLLADEALVRKLAVEMLNVSALRTADAGQRVELDTAGLRLYEPDEAVAFNLPTDPNEAPVFQGTVLSGDQPFLRSTGIPRVRLRQTAAGAQNVPGGGEARSVIFNTEDADTDSFWPAGANDAWIALPFTGQYLVTIGVRITPHDAAGWRRLVTEISTNGGSSFSELVEYGHIDRQNPVAGGPTILGYAQTLNGNAGDIIRFRVTQNSGTQLQMSDANASLIYLGPA